VGKKGRRTLKGDCPPSRGHYGQAIAVGRIRTQAGRETASGFHATRTCGCVLEGDALGYQDQRRSRKGDESYRGEGKGEKTFERFNGGLRYKALIIERKQKKGERGEILVQTEGLRH